MYLYKDMHKISCYLNGKVYYVKKNHTDSNKKIYETCIIGRVFQQTVSTPTGKPMLFMGILSLSFLTSVSGPTQPET